MLDCASCLVVESDRVSLFVYKLTTDDGGAPCVVNGLLSLAICKPMIRKKAKPGDLIFGFAANSLHSDNRLIYVARVAKAIPGGDYYRQRRYPGRPDRIYKWRSDGTFTHREDAQFHWSDESDVRDEHLRHDLGSFSDYERATVLVSDDYRYFGADSPSTRRSCLEFRSQHRPRPSRPQPLSGSGARAERAL